MTMACNGSNPQSPQHQWPSNKLTLLLVAGKSSPKNPAANRVAVFFDMEMCLTTTSISLPDDLETSVPTCSKHWQWHMCKLQTSSNHHHMSLRVTPQHSFKHSFNIHETFTIFTWAEAHKPAWHLPWAMLAMPFHRVPGPALSDSGAIPALCVSPRFPRWDFTCWHLEKWSWMVVDGRGWSPPFVAIR